MTFPKDMYKPAPTAPIIVKDEREYEDALRKGWSETYIHQAYPTTVYGKTHTAAAPDTLLCENPDEHKAALANGYQDGMPVATPPKPKARAA